MDTLTARYRSESFHIRAQTLRDLQKLWPLLDLGNLDDAFAPWASTVATLVRRDRVRQTGLASSYLRSYRSQSGVGGEALVVPAAPFIPEQFNRSIEVTAKAGYYTALRYYLPGQAADVAFVRTAGAVSKMTLNAGRETILGSLRADPKAGGWERVTSSTACAFCISLAGRGAVYSASTAGFSAHDHCACSVRPAYALSGRKVEPFEPSGRNRTTSTRAKDNARVREFIAG